MRVEQIGRMVIVRHRKTGEIVCDAGRSAGNRLFDIQFSDPAALRCNQTRQAAMQALQAAGLK